MNKNLHTLLYIFLAIFAVQVQAQITITAEDLPNINTAKAISIQQNPPIEIGNATAVGQSWNYSTLEGGVIEAINFDGTSEMNGEADFPNADFTRTGPLSTLLGTDIELPIDLPNAVAFYSESTDEGGVVYLEGINIDLTVGGVLELGPQSLLPEDGPYRLWSSGELNDSFNATSTFSLDIPSDELPFDGIDAFVEFIRLTLTLDTDVDIDAHGNMVLPDGNYDVLRYYEYSDVSLKLSPWSPLGIEIDVASIPDVIWEQLGGDFSAIFVDTTFTNISYRFFANDENYPVASISYIDNDSIQAASSIQYLSVPAPSMAAFSYEVFENNCLIVDFSNESIGTSGTGSWAWDYGDGSTGSLSNPTHVYDTEGSYEVSLTFTDAFGAVTVATETIDLACIPLSAEFTATNSEEECFMFTFETLTDGYYTEVVWDFGDGTTLSTEDATIAHTYTMDGTYDVTSTAINPLVDTSTVTQSVEVACMNVGLETAFNSAQYNLYPNPTMGNIQIELNEPNTQEITVVLTDITGRTVHQQHFGTSQQAFTIETNDLANGIYLLKVVVLEKSLLFVEKVVKQ